MCKAFMSLQLNPPEVDFFITLEGTETQESSNVFLSVTQLANDSQDWMPGLLILYPVFFS